MFESYFINPKKGIYYMKSAYHDDVDYVYLVDFDEPNVDEQFKRFLRYVEKDGAKKQMEELRKEFKALGELLG